MQHFQKALLLVFGLLVISCGPKKTAAERKADATKENVIQQNLAAAPSFKTMQGRLRGSYDDGEDSQSISVSIRMEKDKFSILLCDEPKVLLQIREFINALYSNGISVSPSDYCGSCCSL